MIETEIKKKNALFICDNSYFETKIRCIGLYFDKNENRFKHIEGTRSQVYQFLKFKNKIGIIIAMKMTYHLYCLFYETLYL